MKYIESKVAANCLYLIQSFFRKTKKALEIVSLPQFLHNFEEKYLLRCIVLTDLIPMFDCLYFFVMLGNISIVIVCLPGFDVINF